MSKLLKIILSFTLAAAAWLPARPARADDGELAGILQVLNDSEEYGRDFVYQTWSDLPDACDRASPGQLKAVVGLLEKSLASDSKWRDEAVDAVISIYALPGVVKNKPPKSPALEKLLIERISPETEDDPQIRRHAIDALAEVSRSREAYAALVGALEPDRNPKERYGAASFLARFTRSKDGKTSPISDADLLLLKPYLKEENWSPADSPWDNLTLRSIMGGVQVSRRNIPELAGLVSDVLLRHADPGVRHEAAWTLMRMGNSDDSSIRALRAAVNGETAAPVDRDEAREVDVRITAAVALKNIKRPDILRDALKNLNGDDFVKEEEFRRLKDRLEEKLEEASKTKISE